MLKALLGLGAVAIIGFAGLLIAGLQPAQDSATDLAGEAEVVIEVAEEAVEAAPEAVAEEIAVEEPVATEEPVAEEEVTAAEPEAEAEPEAVAEPDFAFDPATDYGLEIDIAGDANGTLVIDLFEDVAPLHVAQIAQIAHDGSYDGVVFHRVIDGFMAQTGDVQNGVMGSDLSRAGTGSSDLPDIPAEFSDLPFERGVIGMARAQNPNSANSQFFIMFDAGYFLNGQYTVVGEVIEGMDVVDAIKRGTGANGAVIGAPDRMSAVRLTQ